jgi:hypothetical protein
MEPKGRLATPPVTTRRDLLRKAAVVGIGAGALLTAGAVTATPALAGGYQSNWRFCRNCKSMVYGSGLTGRCADPRVSAHDTTGSWDYLFLFDTNAGDGFQSDWKYCRNCNSMFWTPGYRMDGACPSGNQDQHHDSYGSFNYSLYYGPVPQTQANWNYCRLCHGLFFGPWRSTSVCPSYPKGSLKPHDGTNSYNYQMNART